MTKHTGTDARVVSTNLIRKDEMIKVIAKNVEWLH